jgi:hypothetical protein
MSSTPIKPTGTPRKPLSARAIKKTTVTAVGGGGGTGGTAGKDGSSMKSTGFGGGRNATVRPPSLSLTTLSQTLPLTHLILHSHPNPNLQPPTPSAQTQTQTHQSHHLTHLTLDLERTERLIAERDVSLDRANDRIKVLERGEREMRARLGEQVCVRVCGCAQAGKRGVGNVDSYSTS